MGIVTEEFSPNLSY